MSTQSILDIQSTLSKVCARALRGGKKYGTEVVPKEVRLRRAKGLLALGQLFMEAGGPVSGEQSFSETKDMMEAAMMAAAQKSAAQDQDA